MDEYRRAYLLQRHTVLNQQGDSGIQVPDIFLEDKVFLRLGGDLSFQFSEVFLGCSARD